MDISDVDDFYIDSVAELSCRNWQLSMQGTGMHLLENLLRL